MTVSVAHRMRCITIKNGVVNVCPECGHVHVTDWAWDMDRDPDPEHEPINLSDEDVLFDFVEACQDLGSNTALPCLPTCEDAGLHGL